MDVISIAGLVVAIGGMIVSMTMEGTHLGALVNLPAAIIIGFGTLGATLFSYPFSAMRSVPAMLKLALMNPSHNARESIDSLVGLAEVARREGLLSLENRVGSLDNELLKLGLTFVVDGIEPQEIRRILENEINRRQHEYHTGASVFDTAGGYAPTMGIIGTVVGLIHVLGNISDTSKLAGAIATAFLATLYGILSANALFLPIGGKLKLRAAEMALFDEIVVEGIIAIVQGKNPRLIRRELEILAGLPPSAEDKGGGRNEE